MIIENDVPLPPPVIPEIQVVERIVERVVTPAPYYGGYIVAFFVATAVQGVIHFWLCK